MKLPELFVPVFIENIEIAIFAGASSVCLFEKESSWLYDNLSLEKIKIAVETAHLYNVDIYLNVDDLVREDDFLKLVKFVVNLYKIGVDGVLVQDLGLIKVIKDILPKFKIFGSNKLNIINSLGLSWAKDINIKRIFLACELDFNELDYIVSFGHSLNLEFGILVHGDLCFAYSGQCLFTDEDRKICSQPCRAKFRISDGKSEEIGSYLLSTKDISLYSELNELLKLDMDCFKFEGIEDKDYLAIVINSYRVALNKIKFKKIWRDPIAIEKLNLGFNRKQSFGHIFDNDLIDMKNMGSGLFIGRIEKVDFDGITIKLKHELLTSVGLGDVLAVEGGNDFFTFEISNKPVLKEKKLFIKKINRDKKFRVSEGYKVYIVKSFAMSQFSKNLISNENLWRIKKSKLAISFYVDKNNFPILKGFISLANGKKLSIKKKGNEPLQIAHNKPLTIHNLKHGLLKIGKLPFIVTDIKFNYNENLFAPISQINNFRREFYNEIVDLIVNSYLPNDVDYVDKMFERFCSNYNNEISKKYELNDFNLSIYINDLDILKFITENNFNFKRVYLEVPYENKSHSNRININYIVNFMKTAVDISKNGHYELIWKWEDIAGEEIKNGFIKALGILNKLNIKLGIMTGFLGLDNYLRDRHNIAIGSKALNICNVMAFLNLKDYSVLTLSSKLSKKDIINFMNKYMALSKSKNLPDPEIIIGGNNELLRTKIHITTTNSSQNLFLDDLIGNLYPIKRDILGNPTIILNSKDNLLFDDIQSLRSSSVNNFAIDCRWRSKKYVESSYNRYLNSY
ncbi:MAG: U32 family peptidase [Methanobrevibacter sp.]|nr:U32 family peptidase [Candidatus Methanovirga procula]